MHRINSKLFYNRQIPEHIRSDNGPEFTARAIWQWLRDLGVKTLYIEPGSSRENGHITYRKVSDPTSLGLIGMRERALIFGGELKINGILGKGTTVALRMPLMEIDSESQNSKNYQAN